MKNVAKRSKGAAEEIQGKIKGSVGKLFGNERMQVEGRAKELKVKGRQASAKMVERAQGTAEQLAGVVQGRVGAALGNERLQIAGKGKEVEGKTRQRLNR